MSNLPSIWLAKALASSGLKRDEKFDWKAVLLEEYCPVVNILVAEFSEGLGLTFRTSWLHWHCCPWNDLFLVHQQAPEPWERCPWCWGQPRTLQPHQESWQRRTWALGYQLRSTNCNWCARGRSSSSRIAWPGHFCSRESVIYEINDFQELEQIFTDVKKSRKSYFSEIFFGQFEIRKI